MTDDAKPKYGEQRSWDVPYHHFAMEVESREAEGWEFVSARSYRLVGLPRRVTFTMEFGNV